MTRRPLRMISAPPRQREEPILSFGVAPSREPTMSRLNAWITCSQPPGLMESKGAKTVGPNPVKPWRAHRHARERRALGHVLRERGVPVRRVQEQIARAPKAPEKPLGVRTVMPAIDARLAMCCVSVVSQCGE